jgi:hypothetical protein
VPATNNHNDDGRKRWFEGLDALGDIIEIVVKLLGEVLGFLFSALLEILGGL